MEHFWDLLFQLMKHGTNTLHVAFIFLFHIERVQAGAVSLPLMGLGSLIETIEMHPCVSTFV